MVELSCTGAPCTDRRRPTSLVVVGIQISPSILSADFANLAAECQSVAGHADWLRGRHGQPFRPESHHRSAGRRIPAEGGGHTVDCHLMIEDPDRWAPGYAEAGAGSVTFHVEAATAPSNSRETFVATAPGQVSACARRHLWNHTPTCCPSSTCC